MKKSLLISFAALTLLCFTIGTAQTTFNYTGTSQTYIVPAFVTSVQVDVLGAKGGNGINPNGGDGLGGFGGRVSATIPVTPGETLIVYVGGMGSIGVPGGGPGGFNGGGNGKDQYQPGVWMGGGGGGASDIRQGGTTLSERVIVAGAGGGGGSNCGTPNGNPGGQGGASIGGDAASCTSNGHGLGGTQSLGGAGGLYQWDCGSGQPGANGALGLGGDADVCSAGGGGGAGYFGGGGGDFGGGGGGSNYTTLNATSVTSTQGVGQGDGMVVITPLLTGTGEFNQNTSLSILTYPNPANATLHLFIQNDGTALFASVMDATGLKVLDFSINEGLNTLAIESLAAGIYFLEVSNGNGTKRVKKFIKE